MNLNKIKYKKDYIIGGGLLIQKDLEFAKVYKILKIIH